MITRPKITEIHAKRIANSPVLSIYKEKSVSRIRYFRWIDLLTPVYLDEADTASALSQTPSVPTFDWLTSSFQCCVQVIEACWCILNLDGYSDGCGPCGASTRSACRCVSGSKKMLSFFEPNETRRNGMQESSANRFPCFTLLIWRFIQWSQTNKNLSTWNYSESCRVAALARVF